MPVHLKEHWAKGGHVPGVFFLRPFASLSAVIEDLYLIWLVADSEEFVDQAFVCRCEFGKTAASGEWFFWSSRLTPILHYDSDW